MWLSSKESTANAGAAGWMLGSGRSPGSCFVKANLNIGKVIFTVLGRGLLFEGKYRSPNLIFLISVSST